MRLMVDFSQIRTLHYGFKEDARFFIQWRYMIIIRQVLMHGRHARIVGRILGVRSDGREGVGALRVAWAKWGGKYSFTTLLLY